MPVGTKLRARQVCEPFHIALLEPEIPQNTGSIARTCAATQSPLHLIGQLGFRIDEKAVRRAGLDYWPLVDLYQHETWEAFTQPRDVGRIHLFSSAGQASYLEADFQPGDTLVFGKESVGLPNALVTSHEKVWAIPTIGGVRSLNLSNSVSIVLFEAMRKAGAFADTFLEEPNV